VYLSSVPSTREREIARIRSRIERSSGIRLCFYTAGRARTAPDRAIVADSDRQRAIESRGRASLSRILSLGESPISTGDDGICRRRTTTRAAASAAAGCRGESALSRRNRVRRRAISAARMKAGQGAGSNIDAQDIDTRLAQPERRDLLKTRTRERDILAGQARMATFSPSRRLEKRLGAFRYSQLTTN